MDIQVTIVVADGRKLVANERENQELFWGVRGGGGNFGVVTQFVYKLHPQLRKVYAGMLVYPPPALEDVFNQVNKWFDNDPAEKECIYIILAIGPDGIVRRMRQTSIFSVHSQTLSLA